MIFGFLTADKWLVLCSAVKSSSWSCPPEPSMRLWCVVYVRNSYVLFKEMTLVGYKCLNGGR